MTCAISVLPRVVGRYAPSMRPLRLALAGFSHETNTFALDSTTFEMVENAGILLGDDILAEHRTALTTVAGYLELTGDPGVELVPLVFSAPNPSGLIERDAFERVTGQIVELLAAHGPWDGVLLALHGAAVAEGFPEADGEIVARVRALVGAAVPIGVTLDLHANLGPRIVAESDVVVLYRTNPHVDARLRAAECGRLVIAAAKREVAPRQALVPIPAAIGILRQATAEEPMRGLMETVDAIATRPGVLSASLAEGFPYADVPHMGMAALVVTDGDPDTAQRYAREIATAAWECRDAFVGQADAPEDALRQADALAAMGAGPILVLDTGDNIGGGSPGDGTRLLAPAVRLGISGFVAILYDPRAAKVCARAGTGARVELSVGGWRDPRGGGPVPVAGTVTNVVDGRYEDPQPTHGGYRFFDAGLTAVLVTDGGQTILLTSRLVMPISLEQLRSAGVVPEEQRILTAKGVVSPRAAYDRVASHAILAGTNGVTAADPTRFDHVHRRRPLFPWESDATLGLDG
jgi:microcystin degradation protein MlrC